MPQKTSLEGTTTTTCTTMRTCRGLTKRGRVHGTRFHTDATRATSRSWSTWWHRHPWCQTEARRPNLRRRSTLWHRHQRCSRPVRMPSITRRCGCLSSICTRSARRARQRTRIRMRRRSPISWVAPNRAVAQHLRLLELLHLRLLEGPGLRPSEGRSLG